MFRTLMIFQRTHGHCGVPFSSRRESLGFWVAKQHADALSGVLTTEHRKRLEQAGVVFDQIDDVEVQRERRWNQMFDALQTFKKEFGHCHVRADSAEHKALASWLSRQRLLGSRNQLRSDRQRRLKVVGIDFESQPQTRSWERTRRAGGKSPAELNHGSRMQSWMQMVDELAAFRQVRGHSRVPSNFPENQSLAKWVLAQRRRYREDKLSPEEFQRLNDLGFVWEPPRNNADGIEAQWNEMLASAAQYKARHGNFDVAAKSPESLRLRRWISVQRRLHQNAMLSIERRRKLDGIEFTWENSGVGHYQQERWEKRFAQLAEFKRSHGHCQVLVCEGNRDLQRWILRQRRQRGKMPVERRRRLEALEFVWECDDRSIEVAVERQWEKRFAELVAFKERFGHCEVSKTIPDYDSLNEWCRRQRKVWKDGTLSSTRVQRLEAVGFTKEFRSPAWEERFRQLLDFRRQHGHCSVPVGPRKSRGQNPLANWVIIQRQKRRLGRLSAEYIRRLDEVGFCWNRRAQIWDEKIAKLAAFQKKHGHCNVSKGEDSSFHDWLASLRTRRHTLGDNKIRQLEELGFQWNTPTRNSAKLDARWEANLEAVLSCKQQSGTWVIPHDHPQHVSLLNWIRYQRYWHRRGKLSARRRERLEQLGFDFELPDPRAAFDAHWETRFAELVAFQRQHGRLNVPRSLPYKTLAGWVGIQRALQKTGRLSPDRAHRLDQVGFVWNRLDQLWEDQFASLADYRRLREHCHVTSEENKALHNWANTQRKNYKRRRLSEARRQRLESLGFEWVVNQYKHALDEEGWERRFVSLLAFKEQQGHWRVPPNWSGDSKLDEWIARQRHFYRNGALAEHRHRRLEAAGFPWDPPQNPCWDKRFVELAAFKQQHGHCNVTSSCQNKKLAHWVAIQRQWRKRGKLSPERIERLDAIGFVWQPLEAFWEQRFAELVAFKGSHGHCRVTQGQNPKLAGWVCRMRADREHLSEAQVQRLDELGFIWDLQATDWERCYEKLTAFHQQHGHCRVSSTGHQTLYSWTLNQRVDRDKLSIEQIRRLDALGFSWNPAGELWEQRFGELAAFQLEHGHCEVSRELNRVLNTWINAQRRGRERLSTEQLRRLEEVGFAWEAPNLEATRLQAQWERHLSEVLACKGASVDWEIPSAHPRASALRQWVNRQCIAWRAGELGEVRRQRLEAAGFPFDLTSATWEKHFNELLEFKRQHGHCRVPRDYSNRLLFHWVSRQRANKRDGKLSDEDVCRLDEIGFAWNVLEQTWEESFAALTIFQRERGHCKVSSLQNKTLSTWVSRQREERRTGTLSPERIRRLDALGFSWDGVTAEARRLLGQWEQTLSQLLSFKERHGHWQVPLGWPDNPNLSRWVVGQRRLRAQGKLPEDRRRRLEEVGFPFDAHAPQWEARLAELMAFKTAHGHFDVGSDHDDLYRWIGGQRVAKRAGRLNPERLQRLENLGFSWDTPPSMRYLDHWEKMLAKLLAAKEDALWTVSPAHPDHKALKSWTERQRSLWHLGQLKPDRQHRLAGHGFIFDVTAAHWDERFAELAAFKTQNGHCNPRTIESASLYHWVKAQLEQRAKLNGDQIRRLDELGFEWISNDESAGNWNEMFALLADFHAEYAHCRVPGRYNPKLACWCRYQRKRRAAGKLPDALFNRLNALGFEWQLIDHAWEAMFVRITAYRQQHGHCRVFQPHDPELFGWAARQRDRYQAGTLESDRVQRLNELGFDWKKRYRSWEQMFEEVKKFHAEHGHFRMPNNADASLAAWVRDQRRKRAQLSEDRRRQLDGLNFDWDTPTDPWEKRFARLLAFRRTHGHCHVSSSADKSLCMWICEQRRQRDQMEPERRRRLDEIGFEWEFFDPEKIWETHLSRLVAYHTQHGAWQLPYAPENMDLVNWVTRQRTLARRGQQPTHRLTRLQEVGFPLEPLDPRWERSLFALREFHRRHGHFCVPNDQAHAVLHNWVRSQCHARKNGELSQEQVRHLDEMKFTWEPENPIAQHTSLITMATAQEADALSNPSKEKTAHKPTETRPNQKDAA